MYPLSKITAERLCHWAVEHYGIDVRIVRPGTVYGPYERPTGARINMSTPHQAAHLALAGETLKPNAPHISQSFIHAMDVARGARTRSYRGRSWSTTPSIWPESRYRRNA